MKQRFLLFLFFVCSFMITTNAQISKGAIWLGGSVGYNKTENSGGDQQNTTKTNSFNITPAIGKVVKDNLVIGVNITYRATDKENSSGSNKSDVNEKWYGGGVFVRQYFPIVSRFFIFGDANAGFSTSKQDENHTYNNITSETRIKAWAANLGITPGLSYGITKKLQLETSLSNLFGISYSKSKAPNYKSDQFTAGLFTDGKTQFNIGCRFLFNNKG